MKLRLLIANYDNLKFDLEVDPTTMTVLQLKQWLNEKLDDNVKNENLLGMKLICMGASLEPDNKLLSECNIKELNYATPVNVSILPKGQTYSQKNVKDKKEKSKSTNNNQPPQNICCTIS